jgi:hypothetical protein
MGQSFQIYPVLWVEKKYPHHWREASKTEKVEQAIPGEYRCIGKNQTEGQATDEIPLAGACNVSLQFAGERPRWRGLHSSITWEKS